MAADIWPLDVFNEAHARLWLLKQYFSSLSAATGDVLHLPHLPAL